MAADPGVSRPDLLVRVEQLRAQSRLLWEQVAELAEAVAEVELEVARVHEGMAAQGESLAAQAAEHARRARDFAAREQAEAERLRRVVAGWGSSLEEPTRSRSRGSAAPTPSVSGSAGPMQGPAERVASGH
jgi:chromosome segregation ATPase